MPCLTCHLPSTYCLECGMMKVAPVAIWLMKDP